MKGFIGTLISEIAVAVLGAFIYYNRNDAPLISAFLVPVCLYRCIYFAVRDARREDPGASK